MTPPAGLNGPLSPQCSGCRPVWLLGAERSALCSISGTILFVGEESFSSPILLQNSYSSSSLNGPIIIMYVIS